MYLVGNVGITIMYAVSFKQDKKQLGIPILIKMSQVTYNQT